MRAREYVGKVGVKVKPRGSLSAEDELRSAVSLGDEGGGQLRGAQAAGKWIGEAAGMAEVKGQDGEGKGWSHLI